MNYKRFYIPNSIIFITIVTNNRIPLLIDNISLIKDSFKNVSQYYDFELIAYIHCRCNPDRTGQRPACNTVQSSVIPPVYESRNYKASASALLRKHYTQ